MKKKLSFIGTLFLAFGFGSLFSSAQAQEPESLGTNVAAAISLTVLPLGAVDLYALPLRKMDGGPLSFLEVFDGSGLIQGTSPSEADTIYTYDPGIQNYVGWFQHASDGLFRKVGLPEVPVNPIMPEEASFWIGSPVNQPIAHTIQISGELFGDEVVCQEILLGHQGLITVPWISGLPKNKDYWLAAGASPEAGVALSDAIHLYDPPSGLFRSYYFLEPVPGTIDWLDIGLSPAPNPLVPFGKGAIYQVFTGDKVLCLIRPYGYPLNPASTPSP